MYTFRMTRGKALQPGRHYHVYNRGNNRQAVFLEPRNYAYFLRLYAHHILPVTDTYAFCLMPNHFHLSIRTKTEAELLQGSDRSERSDPYDPSTALTRAFQSLFMAYTQAINKAHARSGRLFQEHFGRIEITSDRYLTNLVAYIHLNPQKHGFVADFREWEWSSYNAMLSQAATKLKRAEALEWFGGVAQFVNFHCHAVDDRLIAPLIEDDLI